MFSDMPHLWRNLGCHLRKWDDQPWRFRIKNTEIPLKTERNRRRFLHASIFHTFAGIARRLKLTRNDWKTITASIRLDQLATNSSKAAVIASNETRIIENPKRKQDQAWKHIENSEDTDTNWKTMENSSMETQHSHGSRGRCGNLESNTCPTFEIHHIPGCNFKTQWTIAAACHSIQQWRPASSLLSTTRSSFEKSVQNWYLEAKAKSHEDIHKVHPARVSSHDSIYGQPDVWFHFHVSIDVSHIYHWRWKQNMSRGACCAVPKVDSPQTNPEQCNSQTSHFTDFADFTDRFRTLTSCNSENVQPLSRSTFKQAESMPIWGKKIISGFPHCSIPLQNSSDWLSRIQDPYSGALPLFIAPYSPLILMS